MLAGAGPTTSEAVMLSPMTMLGNGHFGDIVSRGTDSWYLLQLRVLTISRSQKGSEEKPSTHMRSLADSSVYIANGARVRIVAFSYSFRVRWFASSLVGQSYVPNIAITSLRSIPPVPCSR